MTDLILARGRQWTLHPVEIGGLFHAWLLLVRTFQQQFLPGAALGFLDGTWGVLWPVWPVWPVWHFWTSRSLSLFLSLLCPLLRSLSLRSPKPGLFGPALALVDSPAHRHPALMTPREAVLRFVTGSASQPDARSASGCTNGSSVRLYELQSCLRGLISTVSLVRSRSPAPSLHEMMCWIPAPVGYDLGSSQQLGFPQRKPILLLRAVYNNIPSSRSLGPARPKEPSGQGGCVNSPIAMRQTSFVCTLWASTRRSRPCLLAVRTRNGTGKAKQCGKTFSGHRILHGFRISSLADAAFPFFSPSSLRGQQRRLLGRGSGNSGQELRYEGTRGARRARSRTSQAACLHRSRAGSISMRHGHFGETLIPASF